MKDRSYPGPLRPVRTAVVTGAGGFIGSALCRELLLNGWRVYGIIRPRQAGGESGGPFLRRQLPHGSSGPRALPDDPNMIVIEGDLTRTEPLAEELGRLEPEFDAFFHLAWSGVAGSERNGSGQVGNIAIAAATVRMARQLRCALWIGTGSQAEYGRLEGRADEQAPERPTTLYGSAKLEAGRASLEEAARLGLPACWVRIFSTYGPGDRPGWLVTDAIRAMLRGQSPKLTAGNQRWDYLHVDDAARALRALAESGEKPSGVYNLGSGRSETIRHVVSLIRDEAAPGLPLQFGSVPYRDDQVMHLEADITRLRELTGWTPAIDLRGGIAATAAAERDALERDQRLTIKRAIVTMAYKAGASHVGAALSVSDIVYTLYAHILHYDPKRPDLPERDKLVFSKAHASSALYAALAEFGCMDAALLKTYCENGGRLPGHLDREAAPGIEVSAGSLGHGLPLAAGLALADRLAGRSSRTFALLGDGECNEGSVWEAAMLASAQRLDSLTVVIDCNGLQGFGATSELLPSAALAAAWRAFGWEVREADGHDIGALRAALGAAAEDGRPLAVIARTVKGHGVDFMQDRLEWHYKSPSREQWASALRQLGGDERLCATPLSED